MPSLRERVEARLRHRFDEIRTNSQQNISESLFEPVFDHLDAVIDVVASMRDYSTTPYLDKVRRVVCTQCVAATQGGCVRRETQTCGLDAYFPIIVGIIESEFKNDSDLPV